MILIRFFCRRSRGITINDYISDLMDMYKETPFPTCFIFLFPFFHFLETPKSKTHSRMKSDLSFLAYLVTHFASHASCAPQGMDGDGFFVSSGQSCNVPVGIVRVLQKKQNISSIHKH